MPTTNMTLPDYNHWLSLDYWSREEAICLIHAIDPQSLLTSDGYGGGSFPSFFSQHELYPMLAKTIQTFERANIFQLHKIVQPRKILKWMISKKIPIPINLKRAADELGILEDSDSGLVKASPNPLPKAEETKDSNPTSTHGNALLYEKNRTEVLGAGIAILASLRDECEDKKQKIQAAKIAKIIDEKALVFWPKSPGGKPPLTQDAMSRLISTYLKKLK